MKKFLFFILLLSFLVIAACSKSEDSQQNNSPREEIAKEVPNDIGELIEKLNPMFQPLGKPGDDEWLATFEEDGQTFEEFLNGTPTLPTDKRKIIYIQPIGKFTQQELSVINETTKYLGIFYNLQTKLLKVQKFKTPLSLLNRHTHPQFKINQIRTGYILDELLKPNLPDDAAALISFTNEDLYPNKNYNYLFGQASLKDRVGVWSLNRLKKNADEKLFLKRTLKIAIHETGHMFSFYHCTQFSCAMNGTNHIVESDKRPLDFCPEDTAKIVWMTEADAVKRFESLAKFCKQNGLQQEAKFYTEKADAVK